jgi:hypothetical protein
METKMEKKITVRAIPSGHHELRHCAQRPWGRERTTVKVVDNPKPPTIVHREGRAQHIYHDEISHADLAELHADPHIVVIERVDELNAALAKLAALRAEMSKVEAAIGELERDR